MPFVTHFKDTDGQQLPIAASTLVTVEIPAAGSADKGGWMQAAQDTTEHYNQQAGHSAPKSSAVIPSCTDPSVFTDHGLRIEYEEQLQGWVLWIDSLPAEACTLTLLFINHSTEDTPVVLPALGGGASDEVVDLSGVFDFATSIMQGGVDCAVDYDCTEIVERFQKGPVTVRVSLGENIGEQTAYGQIINNGYAAQTINFTAAEDGAILVLRVLYSAGMKKILFSCRQVQTVPYTPS